MKKNWTATKLITTGSLGVLTVALQSLGAGIVAVTGTPMLGGIINTFVTPPITVIALFIIDRVGAATVMYTILGVSQLPFPLTGTPGFLPKVPIQILGGVIVDMLYFFLRQNKPLASFVIGGLSNLYVGLAVVEVGRLFSLPGIEQTAQLIYSPLIIFVMILGALGGFLGYLIYQKIKDTSVVKRIQEG